MLHVRRFFLLLFFMVCLSCLAYVPVDVVKERLQVQRGGSSAGGGGASAYRGSMDAFRTILRTEGLRGIYKVCACPSALAAVCLCVFCCCFAINGSITFRAASDLAPAPLQYWSTSYIFCTFCTGVPTLQYASFCHVLPPSAILVFFVRLSTYIEREIERENDMYMYFCHTSYLFPSWRRVRS